MPPSFQDVFVKRVIKRTTRRESETEMWTEGQFMSEGDMKEERFSEQRILSIKQVCTENIGWVRRDRYERDVRLFWVEKRIAGKMLNLVQISKKVFIWQKDMQLSNACVYMYTHVYLIPTYTYIHTYIHICICMHIVVKSGSESARPTRRRRATARPRTSLQTPWKWAA